MNSTFTSPIDYRSFTPTADILWEPVWNQRISLTPCERDLLDTWPLRRLGFIRTFGAGGLVMPTQHSRLAHVQGVFALAAYFQPDDEGLRLGALLHDVGHGPFSHSAETVPGFDHHEAGREIILGEIVGDILRQYEFDPVQIVALTEGKPPNPVRTENDLLHLDHLDFFVRDPFACGWHVPIPANLLSRLHLAGSNVSTDLATAEHLVERILFEHRLFTAPGKVAAEAVLTRLFHLAHQKDVWEADSHHLASMTDADILALLAGINDPEINFLLERLLRHPHKLKVRRVTAEEVLPPAAMITHFNKAYLGQPLVEGQPVEQVSARAAGMLAEARSLLGTFVVELD
jgi:HD superfamily phosphohydrolase